LKSHASNHSHFGCLNITSIQKQSIDESGYTTLGVLPCQHCISLEKEKTLLEEKILELKEDRDKWKDE